LSGVIVDVLDTFEGSMSTRQIYYQCVSRGAVQNCQAGYDRVQRLVVNLRRDGTIPYDRVVDRGRAKIQRAGWDGAQQVVDAAAQQYRRNLWTEQDTVVMVACEKQALEGVFAEAVDPYGASLWIVHGFSSVSFDYEWATDIIAHNRNGKHVVIAFFGDHDPSGLCLATTTCDRLISFGAEFEWIRAGLLEEDFERFDLVNIPVKHNDSRARDYLRQFGDRAAELDALHPDELRRRITEAIEAHIDPGPWNRLSEIERVERESLAMVVGNWETAVAAARGAA
jgi:hypothetical protein